MTDPLTFADLGLHPKLVQGLTDAGYAAPTPIQAQAIPPLLAGRDLAGQAQTGTGKTAAFSLPIIQGLDIGQRKVQALILCPTRELALQVTAALSSYGQSRDVRVLTIYGGTPIHKQISQLRGGVHVVVGTPGRVKDCIGRGALSLGTVRFVVLDEADEMLRMGFIEDVEEILSGVPRKRQTALFSATMPAEIQRVAASYLRDPERIVIEKNTRAVERIDQRVLVTHAGDKLNVLARLIEAEPTDAVLVFARTRLGCAHLVEALRARGVAGAALHGDLSQDQREAIVAQLRARKIQLVVATDVAARGLDVEGISHVINYDPPSDPEVYVHRIGRTGRAGREGVSILLVTPKERRLQRAIEKYTGQPMVSMKAPTNEQLLAGRMARFRARVHETIEEGGLDPYREVVEEMLGQPDADPREIAAALARLASGDHPLRITEPEPSTAKPAGPPPPGEGGGRVHLFISLGSEAGVRPADIVGAIANEAGLPGSAIGAIDVRPKVSFVEVSAEDAATIVELGIKVKVRGLSATLVPARPGSFERGRREASPRRGGRPGHRRFSAGRPSPAGKDRPWRKSGKKR